MIRVGADSVAWLSRQSAKVGSEQELQKAFYNVQNVSCQEGSKHYQTWLKKTQ